MVTGGPTKGGGGNEHQEESVVKWNRVRNREFRSVHSSRRGGRGTNLWFRLKPLTEISWGYSDLFQGWNTTKP